jgi:hypothetical protein
MRTNLPHSRAVLSKDANFLTNSTDQKQFVEHLTEKWGQSLRGGVKPEDVPC